MSSSLFSFLGPFESPLTLILLIAAPAYLPRLIAFFQSKLFRQEGAQPPPEPAQQDVPTTRPSTPPAFYIITGIHTLLLLYKIFNPPYNVFIDSSLPITISPTLLRTALESHPYAKSQYPLPTIAGLTSQLCTSTNWRDPRLIYSRFGHTGLACGWCRSVEDYALVGLPRSIGGYLFEVVAVNALIALVGGKQKWRNSLNLGIAAAAGVETWARMYWYISIVDGEAIQLDHRLHLLRSLFFLFLPLILFFLPSTPPPNPSQLQSPSQIHLTLLSQILPSLSASLSSTASLNLLRASSLRNPTLRDIVVKDAEEKESEARQGRSDAGVKRGSKNFGWVEDDDPLIRDTDGTGFVDVGARVLVRGGLREKARENVESNWQLLNALGESHAQMREAQHAAAGRGGRGS